MLQFSTRSLLLLLFYISCVFAIALLVLRHMRFYDVGLLVLYPGKFGCLTFVAICTSAVFRLFQPKGTASWYWLSTAWLLACSNVLYGIYLTLFTMDEPHRGHFQEGFSASIISTVPLAILFTLPIVLSLTCNGDLMLPSRSAWIPVIIGVIDTFLVWLLASILYGTVNIT